MALSVDGLDVNKRITVRERKTNIGIGNGVSMFEHVFETVQRYESGTGSSKIDCVYSARQTLSGGFAVDLRSSLLSVLDGSVVSFPLIVGVFFKNLSTTTLQSVTLGGGSNPWITWLTATGDGIKVGPSGWFELFSPIDAYATTSATADILQLTEATGTPSVEIMIVGRQS